MEIGEKVKTLRKQAGLRLVQLAQKSGVGLGTLSRMENGKGGNTVETHHKIATALGIGLADLYQDTAPVGAETAPVAADSPEAETFLYDDRASAILLARQVTQKHMLPQLIVLKPGGSTHQEQHRLGCEKWLFVLEGTVEVTVGVRTYSLTPHGTLYFKASLPHQLTNTGKETAQCLSVTSPVGL